MRPGVTGTYRSPCLPPLLGLTMTRSGWVPGRGLIWRQEGKTDLGICLLLLCGWGIAAGCWTCVPAVLVRLQGRIWKSDWRHRGWCWVATPPHHASPQSDGPVIEEDWWSCAQINNDDAGVLISLQWYLKSKKKKKYNEYQSIDLFTCNSILSLSFINQNKLKLCCRCMGPCINVWKAHSGYG